jgi:hypothetical protein
LPYSGSTPKDNTYASVGTVLGISENADGQWQPSVLKQEELAGPRWERVEA